MGGPAVGGAPGPALPDLIVLEVGVAEVPQGRPERCAWALGMACVRPLVPPVAVLGGFVGRSGGCGPPQWDRAPWADSTPLCQPSPATSSRATALRRAVALLAGQLPFTFSGLGTRDVALVLLLCVSNSQFSRCIQD